MDVIETQYCIQSYLNLFQPIKSVKDVTLQFFSLTNIWLTINVGNKSGLNFANKNEGK